jgi:hypothetical protein
MFVAYALLPPAELALIGSWVSLVGLGALWLSSTGPHQLALAGAVLATGETAVLAGGETEAGLVAASLVAR